VSRKICAETILKKAAPFLKVNLISVAELHAYYVEIAFADE
jgi:hypothetical protein